MRVGDPVDQVLALSEYGNARFGAIAVLVAAYESCAPEFCGGGDPCARQMSGEAIADVRASLQLALEAFDEARARCPSGPVRLVPVQSANSETSRG
jgi:hypothetical protein